MPNDIAGNERENFICGLKEKLSKLTQTNIIVVNKLRKHDLVSWTSVNKKLKAVFANLTNVNINNSNMLAREFFSKLRLHPKRNVLN